MLNPLSFPIAIAFGLVLAVLAPAGRADAAVATARLGHITGSSAAPGLAADGRTSTAWRPRHGRAWRWQARLDDRPVVVGVELLLAGTRQRVTVSTSTDGRSFAPVRTVVARPGRRQTVRLRRANVRAVMVKSLSPASRTRLVEVRVHVAPKAPSPGAPAVTQAPPSAAPSLSSPAPDAAAPAPNAVPGAPSYAPTGPAPAPVARSGSFAGVLTTPIDPAHLTSMPFGKRSHWLQPWRAYLDTAPAQQLREAVGINFNVNAAEAPSVARLLAANGFRQARIEIGWGDLDYDHPDRLRNPAEWQTKLQALRNAGLRPLLLLNSNDARPAPAKKVTLKITKPVSSGARTAQLDAASAAAVVPRRTGFDGGGRAAAVLITSVSSSGLATLAAPMPAAVPAGTYPGTTVRYEPFSPLTNTDGSPSARGQATMAGWLDYVDTATGFVQGVLGSTGFDVEVTNEVTFGAAFYNINEYYSPALTAQPLDPHVLLEQTVKWVKAPVNGLAGVRVASGVSNQSPWDTPATAPAGLDAFGKHLYPRYLGFPQTRLPNLAVEDGAVSGSSFAPSYITFFPEYYLTGIQTETMVRDIAPIKTTVKDPSGVVLPHGRDVTAPDGTSPGVWMTEMGLETGWVAGALGQLTTRTELEHIKAKSTLRTLVSFVNKGVTQIDFYAAGTAEWGLIGDGFWGSLHSDGAYPGDDSGGPAISGVGRVVDALGGATITTRRSLTLASVGDYAGRTQWAGGGGRPALFDRDVLAFLPFQASDHKFVIPVYVMTRNMAAVYSDADGPERYDLPAERFQMTIGGTDAARAKVSALDPLTGESAPVSVVDRTAGGWLVVEMPVTDSPRLLTIDDTP